MINIIRKINTTISVVLMNKGLRGCIDKLNYNEI